MVEISVIYYVSNNESFIEKSLKSILNQTLEEIEVICIDNASTDESHKILEEYAESDDRISITSFNGTAFDEAMNKTLKQASAGYVYMTNAGCILKEDALEVLLKKATANDADIAASNMEYYDEKLEEKREKKCFEVLEEKFDYTKISNLIDIDYSTNNKLFRRDFIEENNLTFKYDEKSFIYESVFSAKTIFYVKKALFSYDSIYFRLENRNDSQLFNIIPFSNMLLDLFKKSDVLEDYQRKLYDHKMYITTEGLKKIGKEYKEEYFNKLRVDLKEILYDESFCETFIENISGYYRKIFELVLISETYYEYELLKKTYHEMESYYAITESRNFYEKAQESMNN